jgi:hypothetical protein
MQLADWKDEIRVLSGGSVEIVRVETDRSANVLRIPSQFAGRPLVVSLLQQETFVAQFVRAHALSVNYSGTEGTFHLILLNMARQADWDGLEDSLLAHELGHVWLHASGYRAPSFENSCLTTHVGDIVQHVLIRAETRRRGFDYMTFWTRNQERWLAVAEKQDAVDPLDACGRLQLISAWLDAALGLTIVQWDQLDRYLKFLRARYAELEPAVTELAAMLSALNLWDRSLYELALARVSRRLQAVRTGSP